jgi:hypothetical protein
MVSDDEDAIAQNEAISNASDGVEKTCDGSVISPIDHSQVESSIKSSLQEKIEPETDPSAIPRAA